MLSLVVVADFFKIYFVLQSSFAIKTHSSVMPGRRGGSIGNNMKHVCWISFFKKEVKIAIAALSPCHKALTGKQLAGANSPWHCLQ